MAFAAVLGTIASAVSGVIGAIGAIQQGNAAAASAEYNAKIAERNATIVENNRAITVRQSEVDAEEKRRENRRTLSSVRAAYGASGLELAGSPLDVLEDSALELELDASRIEAEGKMRSSEMAAQGIGLREDANLSRMSGRAARSAGYINAAGALFGTVGRTLSRTA